jgi:hypothetical protein
MGVILLNALSSFLIDISVIMPFCAIALPLYVILFSIILVFLASN